MIPVSLDEIVRRVEEIPALPKNAHQVIKLTEDPKTVITDLSNAISNDQALAAKVLRLANSAYYGYARRIITISDAVIILGYGTIRNLVMAASVHGVMDRELPGYVMARGELWKQSMVSALLARKLAARCGFDNPEKAFVAGLLHDIGKIILNTYMAEAYAAIIERVNTEKVPFMKAEEEVLGFNHAVVGGKVAEKWNLPEELVEAISCHHNPREAKVSPALTAITHLTDIACMTMGIGLGADGLLYPYDDYALEILQTTHQELEEVMAEVGDNMFDLESLFPE
jgi:putative nucleotidyltransferase with HDIG domain